MSTPAEKLQDAIGLIKDEYIEEAHEPQIESESGTPSPVISTVNPQPRKRHTARLPLAIAASLVLIVGVGAFALFNSPSPKADITVSTEKHETSDRESKSIAAEEADGYVMGAAADSYAATSTSESLMIANPGSMPPGVIEAEANLLTAAEWNDNANWPFFTNLVNGGLIEFPVFGIDPTHRVKATITDGRGDPVRNADVTLFDEGGTEIWRAKSGKDGSAYLFYRDGQTPALVSANGITKELTEIISDDGDRQGSPIMRVLDDVTITVDASSKPVGDLQVMFIVDTTGSMSDELAYLQKDFAAIAGDVGSDGVTYSVNFYRDESDDYVTKCNDFTSDIATVQALLGDEYADGGGDEPEAVADILAQTITDNAAWKEDSCKVAFLIFDAPPHNGTDDVLDAAVRSAAERGIRLVPVVASNASRTTELFGRALAICTNGTYVFLTDDSGIGDAHLEPIVGDYTVESLHDVIVRIIEESR